MQVTQTSAEGLKREYKIVVDHGDITRLVDRKLIELGQRIRMPGFRPGKVPQTLLKKQYGKSVLGEVLEETVNNATQQAIADNALRPALQPRIEVTKFEEGADLEYSMSVEVLPEIVPGDFSTVKLERLAAAIDDQKVDEMLRRMAEQQKTFTAVSDPRPAQAGDALLIDFVGKIDGVTFDGGTAVDFQLELGSGSFIPGFEDQLIGVSAGDNRAVEVTFPAGYGNKDLAGKAAVFDVAVKELRAANPVSIDDELAKRMGLENLAALRDAVRQQLQQEYASFSRARLKRSLLDALAERYDFPIPGGMVDMEFEQIWQQVKQNAPAEPPADAKPEDEERAEYRKIAERRVRLGLLLSEVGRLNNIEVKPDEVSRAMLEQARRFPGQERQVMDYFQKNPQAMAELRAPIYEDKVIDFILELAQVSERETTPEELMRDPDEPAPAEAASADEAAAKPKAKRKSKKAEEA